MTPAELEAVVDRLRKQGRDDAEFEAKACSEGLSKDVWDTVSAFGNTRGGTLLLGLAEDLGFHRALSFPIDKVIDQFIEGIGSGGKNGRKVENPPQYELDRVDFEEGQILVIELTEIDNRLKPCYVKSKGIANGSYKRVDDKDVKLSAVEVFELQHIMEPSLADKEAVSGADLGDLDEGLVNSLLDAEKAKGSKAVRGTRTPEEALRRLNALTSNNEVALAGLLCLGQYPQQFFPRLTLDVAVHPGIEKSMPDSPRFIDRVICEGSVGEMIDEALLAVAKNLRTFSYVEGSGRRDELEVPREVLREAIANAVVHREYGKEFVGQSISIDIFADRIEVTNPGGLWGGKTIETLSDGQSRCRNDALIKLAARLQRPNEGAPVEGQGSGIPLMFHEMRTHALSDPCFVSKFDSFKVILQRGGAELIRNKEWIKQFVARETDSKEDALLLELRRREHASISELHASLGYDSDDIRSVCARLVADGLVWESAADEFSLTEGSAGRSEKARPARAVILEILSEATEPIGIQEIARISQRKLPTLRAQIAALVSEGTVIATAPPTNRNRKYLLASSAPLSDTL